MTGPGTEPSPDGARPAAGVPEREREALAAHLCELERLAAGAGASGGEGAPPELRAMLARLREVVAALDGLLASTKQGPGAGDAPGP